MGLRDEVSSDALDSFETAGGRRHLSARLVYPIALISFFLVGAAWSVATPLLAAPDEPSQIVKAASVDHGRWTAQCYDIPNACIASTTDALGFEALPTFWDLIRAPDVVDNGANSQICFKQKTQPSGAVPASCARSLNTPATALEIADHQNEWSSTYQARYPPLYYAIVGLPTLFPGSTIDVYMMRLISALASAIFLALALTAAVLYSSNRLLIAGLVVATTPMVFFLGGVINPSGLEISSAIAVWTTGAIVVSERLASPPPGLVAMFGISAVTMELVRPLSPLWLALSVAVLAAFAERRALVSALKTRAVQLWAGLVGIFGVVAVWWIVAVHATDLYLGGNPHPGVPNSVSTMTILETAFRHNSYYLLDMVGVFGWFDTYSPTATYALWFGFAGLLTLAAASRSLRRTALFAGFVVAILVIPVLIETSQARTNGYTWSGRDLLPFAVGLPILAGASLGTRPWRRLSTTFISHTMNWLIVLAAIAQLAAFYEALRRYAVGTKGAILGFLTNPLWHPAIGIIGALAFEVIALAIASLTYWWASRASDRTALGAESPTQGVDPQS